MKTKPTKPIMIYKGTHFPQQPHYGYALGFLMLKSPPELDPGSTFNYYSPKWKYMNSCGYYIEATR